MGTGLTATRHSRIDDVAGTEELFAGAPLYESPGWLRYCERLSGGRMTYLVARDEHGSPVGLTATRIVRPGQVMALYDLGTLFDDWKPAALYPNVVSAVSGSHWVDRVLPGIDPAPVRAVLGKELAEVAAELGCPAAAALYVDEMDSARQLSAAMGGSPPFIFAAQTLLTGQWSSFDDYVASLKRSRRNKVRRELRECRENGIRISVHSGTKALGEDTARLQVALREKYAVGGSVESVLADYENLRATVEDRLLVFRAERDGRLLGMSIALLDGDRLHLRLVGFDYSQELDFLYFTVLFYAPIEWGSRNGMTSYAFGTSSYPAKLARGCLPAPLYAVVRWPDADRAACEERARAHEKALSAELGIGDGEGNS
ncbi:peptidoglycan biosynthesis/recognition protein [Amycolatopsis sulphurea]|uniref:Peptidoglycan biosynthesis/recognition protein n=1 Tax=Amycolatopsis sulphurea TaxID=76022 RepID=A0A2A9G309_9PSEU|nr:GNAT family N-acetyltransferase [Amycolatopsis sulphurea]PFG57242.1 peptidoglycan biosynthesis/recognition protein [Amycolatopsis sulphurea]